MFLNKVKLAMTAVAVVVALVACAVALAQWGIGRPKEGTSKAQHAGSPSWTYHILVSRDGEPRREVAVVEMTGDMPIRVDTPGALILFQPKRDGEPDRQTAAEKRGGDIRIGSTDEKTGRFPADAAANPSGTNSSRTENNQEHPKIVLTSPKTMDVDITQRYVCQMHAQRYISVRAVENGFLSQISVKDGQAVKKGDLMFKIAPIRSKAKLDAGLAEVRLAEREYQNTEKSFRERKVLAQNEVQLSKAKLDRAKAKADLAQAELNFTDVTAPFDGMIDRLHEQQGSLLKEGEILTTLSDNRVMWVYFNVPEKQYLEYMANRNQHDQNTIELMLANQTKFPQPGKLSAIEAKFNSETGTIPFRADFPNPDGLLRHGQTGTILIHRKVHDATVIPVRATYELLDKRYVYVVDKDAVVHQREIVVQNEMDDIFVIKKGVGVGDRIVLEGSRQVRDGEQVKYEFRPPDEVMRKPTNRSE